MSNAVVFAATAIMAGLGFAVLGTLALFALVAIAVAMIASPFAARVQAPADANTTA